MESFLHLVEKNTLRGASFEATYRAIGITTSPSSITLKIRRVHQKYSTINSHQGFEGKQIGTWVFRRGEINTGQTRDIRGCGTWSGWFGIWRGVEWLLLR